MTVAAGPNAQIVPVILAGGIGRRLWPLSRIERPKQFLALDGPLSLFQNTLKRVADRRLFASPVVSTQESYRFLVAEQAAAVGIEPRSILLESEPTGTAFAIAAAASAILADGGDCHILVLPSDHRILDPGAFLESVRAGLAASAAGYLVTFGVTAEGPETGFGYIQAGATLPIGARPVDVFVEKPDALVAADLVASGKCFWNSGIFLFQPRTFLSECRRHSPEICICAENAVARSRHDGDFTRLKAKDCSQAPKIAVDRAVFELTDRTVMIELNAGWSDLGTFGALGAALASDESGNGVMGPATVHDSTNCLVVSDGPHIAVTGLENVAVIATQDAVFVGPRSEPKRVEELVHQLASAPQTADLVVKHPNADRPWGRWEEVSAGPGFKIKRLFVSPGKELSLQFHQWRAEHWVVVKGQARVRIENRQFDLGADQGTYVPQGAIHRLGNPGDEVLEIVEVQTGSYLEEDDIVRLEDSFGRAVAGPRESGRVRPRLKVIPT